MRSRDIHRFRSFTQIRYSDHAPVINELNLYHSDINGSGSLDWFLRESNYEKWLKKVMDDIDIANIHQIGRASCRERV